jgi:hypothetical protein
MFPIVAEVGFLFRLWFKYSASHPFRFYSPFGQFRILSPIRVLTRRQALGVV